MKQMSFLGDPAEVCSPPNNLWSPEQSTRLYTSPPMRIGKHWWRCIVYRHPIYAACTQYQWVRAGVSWTGEKWRSDRDWPRFNGNDTDLGLPRSLGKLYEKFAADIQASLEHGFDTADTEWSKEHVAKQRAAATRVKAFFKQSA